MPYSFSWIPVFSGTYVFASSDYASKPSVAAGEIKGLFDWNVSFPNITKLPNEDIPFDLDLTILFCLKMLVIFHQFHRQ